jgi:hypothetical protein
MNYTDSQILLIWTTHRKHSYSIVACVTVGVLTWSLPTVVWCHHAHCIATVHGWTQKNTSTILLHGACVLQLCCLALDVLLLLRANCGNVFTDSLPSNRYTCYNILKQKYVSLSHSLLLACIGSMKWVKSVNISVLASIGTCDSMECHTPSPPLTHIFSSHCAWVLRPPGISWEDLADMPVMGLLAGGGTRCILLSPLLPACEVPLNHKVSHFALFFKVSAGLTQLELLLCHCFSIIPVCHWTVTIKWAYALCADWQ